MDLWARRGTVVAAALLAVLSGASVARAHGGTYRPPPEDEPPDPPPPDPPPTEEKPPERPQDPEPPPEDPKQPPQPPDGGGTPTPPDGGGAPTPPSPPTAPPGGTPTDPNRKNRKARTESLETWQAWWMYSRDRWLLRPRRAPASGTSLGASAGTRDDPEEEGSLEGGWRGRAAEALRKGLASRDVEVFTGCAVALGKGGDPLDAAGLLRALEGRYADATVRESAVLGLGLLGRGAPGAREALLAVVRDRRDSPRLRSMAAMALGLSGDAAAAPALLSLSREKGSQRDPAAGGLVGLGLLGEPLVVPDLVDMLDDDGSPETRALRPLAAYALGRIGGPEAVRALGRVLADRDEEVRRSAVLALGECSPADAAVMAPLLSRVSREDRDRPCRSFALVTIARIGGPSAHDALARGWGMGDRGERNFAAIAFGILARDSKDPEFRARIGSMLRGEFEQRADADFRGALAVGLGLLGDQRAVPALRSALRGKSHPALRAHCALALGLLGARDASEDLLAALREKGLPELQREAALGLGLLGEPGTSAAALAAMLKDGATHVRVSAAAALGNLGGGEAAGHLTGLLLDERAGDIARGQAAVGLGLLLDPRPVGGLATIPPGLNYLAASPALYEVLTIP